MTPKKENYLIRNCSWKFKCKKTWDSLLETKEYSYQKIRYCPDCKEDVHLVTSEKELFIKIEHDRCVAIPFEITRFSKQLNRPLLGAVRIKG
jgi:Zn finger protein HypA/HybF involved in hydrogenase expression